MKELFYNELRNALWTVGQQLEDTGKVTDASYSIVLLTVGYMIADIQCRAFELGNDPRQAMENRILASLPDACRQRARRNGNA